MYVTNTQFQRMMGTKYCNRVRPFFDFLSSANSLTLSSNSCFLFSSLSLAFISSFSNYYWSVMYCIICTSLVEYYYYQYYYCVHFVCISKFIWCTIFCKVSWLFITFSSIGKLKIRNKRESRFGEKSKLTVRARAHECALIRNNKPRLLSILDVEDTTVGWKCWREKSWKSFVRGWEDRWRPMSDIWIQASSTRHSSASGKASVDKLPQVRRCDTLFRAHHNIFKEREITFLRSAALLMPALGADSPKFVENLYRKVLEVKHKKWHFFISLKKYVICYFRDFYNVGEIIEIADSKTKCGGMYVCT